MTTQTTLTATQRSALDALRASGRDHVTWETDCPVSVNGTRISKQTLDALTKRGILRREYLGAHRVSGQRIPSRFGRNWRKGYTTFTYRYHLEATR